MDSFPSGTGTGPGTSPDLDLEELLLGLEIRFYG